MTAALFIRAFDPVRVAARMRQDRPEMPKEVPSVLHSFGVATSATRSASLRSPRRLKHYTARKNHLERSAR